MRRHTIFSLICLLGIICLYAQDRIVIHNSGRVMYESSTAAIDSISFQNSVSSFSSLGSKVYIPVSEIDSITFSSEEVKADEETVYVFYNGANATVINLLQEKGVSVTVDKATVSITSTTDIDNIEYHISGATDSGSLAINSTKNLTISLNSASITNASGSAVSVSGNVTTTIKLPQDKNSKLSDGTSSKANGTILAVGDIVFEGSGSLSLMGYKKHGVSTAKSISVKGGSITISQAASDGLHSEGFLMDGGSLDIQATSDAIDAGGGQLTINDGDIKITSTTQDVKGIKSDADLTINGGKIAMTVSGAQSKGVSSKQNITINGGDISITISGATVLEALDSGYDPSYCTAIKSTGSITMTDGSVTIVAPSSNDGAKGFSADQDVIIEGGTLNISIAGSGTTYTNELGAKDSYTACCIKSDLNTTITGGNVTCTSTGAGGKGISADGTLVIGELSASDANLVLNVTTSGERFYVSGSGNNADYANPKAIKSEGNLTVNSGAITIKCTQTGEGGEGLESKSTLTINGGTTNISAFDDCINASTHIAINGGNTYCVSSGNDAIDSNGTLAVTGGVTIANGSRSPECGIDCDQSQFKVTGGILIGTGGSTSNPTTSVTTQNTVKYTGTAGNSICIKNSSGEIILLYQIPTYTGTSTGGGPGGGGGNSSSSVVLFSDPKLTKGSYTIQYGGSISGGTTVNGYNTGGSYTGGSSKSFTISSVLTTI